MPLIAVQATPAEIEEVEKLKAHFQRRTNSDLLRFLIHSTAQKIFTQNVSIDTTTPTQGDQQK